MTASGTCVTKLAAQRSDRRAKAHGIGAVGVRNSNHFGTCMYYTRMGTQEGCVMLLTSNGGPAMAPWGGRKKIIGTNPWSVAAPAGRHPPFVMDMANTGVARGKIYLARNKRQPIPLGWAINAAGEPTTDPQEAIDGIILPMAGHKGYAIAMMVDMLSGVLTGSGFLSAGAQPVQDRREKQLRPLHDRDRHREAFQPLAQFNARMEALHRARSSRCRSPKDSIEVFYPGEMEANNEIVNRRDGLALPEDTLADLARIARETGLECLVAVQGCVMQMNNGF